MSGSRDLTVNGKKAEQASLIIDRLVVVENRDACMPLLDDPQVQAQAVDLPVRRLPDATACGVGPRRLASSPCPLRRN